MRRVRLGLRHRLAPKAKVRTPEEVAGGLVGLHATDAATVFLSVAAEAERLQRWLGSIRVTPRFHPPLELELSA